jgi:hypothetical protein
MVIPGPAVPRSGGIQTVVLKGNPNTAGVYTIMLRVPAHTKIAAHSHRNDRVATVISGTWRIGYGEDFDEAKLKALRSGSFYTEPPSEAHFAETGDEAVIVQITGFGPSSTFYVDPTQDPRRSHGFHESFRLSFRSDNLDRTRVTRALFHL